MYMPTNFEMAEVKALNIAYYVSGKSFTGRSVDHDSPSNLLQSSMHMILWVTKTASHSAKTTFSCMVHPFIQLKDFSMCDE